MHYRNLDILDKDGLQVVFEGFVFNTLPQLSERIHWLFVSKIQIESSPHFSSKRQSSLFLQEPPASVQYEGKLPKSNDDRF